MNWVEGFRKAAPALRRGVKYLPAAKGAYDTFKGPVGDAVKGQNERVVARRAAYREAETVLDGSVLRIMRHGQPRWVVYSGDVAISVHPFREGDDLEELTRYADLSKRETPEQRREQLLQARVRRAATRRMNAGGRRRQDGGPDESPAPPP